MQYLIATLFQKNQNKKNQDKMKTKKLKESRSWFKWDYKARHDEKISKLIRDEGFEGYGIFVMIVEYLHENDGSATLKDFCYEFRITNKVRIKRILNNYNIFYYKEETDTYGCNRIDEELAERKHKSMEATKSINIRWNKNN